MYHNTQGTIFLKTSVGATDVRSLILPKILSYFMTPVGGVFEELAELGIRQGTLTRLVVK